MASKMWAVDLVLGIVVGAAKLAAACIPIQVATDWNIPSPNPVCPVYGLADSSLGCRVRSPGIEEEICTCLARGLHGPSRPRFESRGIRLRGDVANVGETGPQPRF